ncbi:MAG: leucine-rich repeat domain-containing protein [Planctomycetes bacterium]|nr:leucine-rich repeat domain-containing protein [Planctomycetota bacterium]
MEYARKRRKVWPWLLIGLLGFVFLLLLRFGDQFLPRKWWPPHNRSGHSTYPVGSAADLDDVPWYENDVSISDPELTDDQLSAFLQNNSISQLRVVRCPKITAKGLVGLEHSAGLDSLAVPQLNIDDGVSQTLAKLGGLERLDLGDTQIHELSDDAFENNPELRMLDVSGCKINRNLLARCAAHKSLRSLDLSTCTGIGAEDLAALAESDSLEHIDLTNAAVSSAALDRLCRIPTLRQ